MSDSNSAPTLSAQARPVSHGHDKLLIQQNRCQLVLVMEWPVHRPHAVKSRPKPLILSDGTPQRMVLDMTELISAGLRHASHFGDKEMNLKQNNWTREQLKLAFHLYCQLPFGKLSQGTREVIELSKLIGRTPSAVAMKACNFASLDPAITSSGRKGLGNASALDREIWEEFNADWEGLAIECDQRRIALAAAAGAPLTPSLTAEEAIGLEDFTGKTRLVVTEQRVKQHFFRRAVLSGYRGRCCMSGISDSRLLVASHIVPWSKDKANRLNPRNGLCLSAIHDKAFDIGLISLTDDYRVIVSAELKRSKDAFVKTVIVPLNGRPIELPERFVPHASFVARHRAETFVDGKVHS
jgi:hypothetical protein